MCLVEKLTQTNVLKTSEPKIRALLELVQSDFCVLIEKLLKGGAQYFVSFIDNASKTVSVYSIQAKSNVLECFRWYLFLSEKQTGFKIEFLQSDVGGEYIRAEFQRYLATKGIHSRRSCSYTPNKMKFLKE